MRFEQLAETIKFLQKSPFENLKPKIEQLEVKPDRGLGDGTGQD